MNHDELMQYLEKQSPAELFFVTYRQKKERPEELRAFLNSLDHSLLRKKNFFIPELLENSIPKLRLNPDGSNRRSVRLQKQLRCAPRIVHTHDFFELLYVLRGSCEQEIAGQTLQLKEGELVLLSPACPHAASLDEDTLVVSIRMNDNAAEMLFSNILHGRDVVSEFLHNAIYIGDYASYLYFPSDSDDVLRNIIMNMFLEEFQPDEYAERIIRHLLSILFLHIVRQYKHVAQSPVSSPVYTETSYILQYLQANYATATLAELSRKLNYSMPYCSKYIKEHTGCTFSQLQKQIRFQKAVDYLRTSDLSIARISEQVGYSNAENFMRMFKQMSGVSPTQYRFNHR